VAAFASAAACGLQYIHHDKGIDLDRLKPQILDPTFGLDFTDSPPLVPSNPCCVLQNSRTTLQPVLQPCATTSECP